MYATRFVWTVVILNSPEASGPFSNGRALKMEAKRGVGANPLEPPLPMGLQCGNSTVRQLGVDHLSPRLIYLTDCSFIPRICGVGTRLVIVTIQLLFVEATIVYTCSAVVVNKLGEGAVMLNANALQS